MIPDIFKYVVIRSDLIKYVYLIITGNIQTRKPSYGSFTLSKNEIFTAGQRNWGEGNVFTGVCQSFCPQWGGISGSMSFQGDISGTRSLLGHPPPSPGHGLQWDTVSKWAVRILLECFLVSLIFVAAQCEQQLVSL